MSQRKHLWSADWERELEPPDAPSPVPLLPGAADSVPARGRWRPSALTVVAVLVLATASIWAVASHRGGSGRSGGAKTATRAPARIAPASPSHADALGLTLVSAPGNRVVVQAVVPGSPATAVGIGAGEDLLTINGHRVTAPGQAEAILKKLPLGTPVTMQLTQGAAQITAQIQEPGIP